MGLEPLPIDEALPAALAALRQHRRLVLTAPPGSGKTTRLPSALLDDGVEGEVLVLEPRRLAARGAARRVAEERGVPLGDEVGYQVRHDRKVSKNTRIRFVTEGILVRRLCDDPFLDGVGAVVVDEFHERHVEGDLALAMLGEVLGTVRDDLMVCVMSATLDAEPVAAFLGGCPIHTADGRLHPVETVWADRDVDGPLEHAVRDAVGRALDETSGDVLAFLPGMAEIRATESALQNRAARDGLAVLPLHGALDPDQQDRAVRPIAGTRKVVLSTNVAESSLTIQGVTAVVDSGLARILRHDPTRGMDALRVEPISRASADQRAGRAGRTGPGRCYRLWTAGADRGRPAFDTAEIRRCDLAGPALQVRAFAGRPPGEFGWFESPDSAALERADELLERIGALGGREGERRVTKVGQDLLKMPLHPRLGRIVLEGRARGVEFAAAEVAALLDERDLLRPAPRGHHRIDIEDRLERLHAIDADKGRPGTCRAYDADPGAARAILRSRDQIVRRARRADHVDHDELALAVLTGFPDRVAKRGEGDTATMVGGRGLRLAGPGLAPDDELFVALRVAETGRDARSLASLVLAIDREQLDAAFPKVVQTRAVAEFDEARGQVFAIRRTAFHDLVLDERRGGATADPALVEQALADRVRVEPFRWLGEQRDLHELIARRDWLVEQGHAPDLPPLGEPEVAEAAASMCAGKRSLKALKDAPIPAVILSSWSQPDRSRLDSMAPTKVQLPSGRAARIDYRTGPEPLVAARLQEFFGVAETPRIGGGAPVLLHLLAPNHRPVQITRDLASFWANVYPGVRSELRRRYPKHSWPEDPLTAVAESRPKRRRR